MKYYSEKLNKLFDTVEALEEEELKLKAKEEEKRAAAEREENDAKKLEEEFEHASNVLSDYLKLAKDFYVKYGYLPHSDFDNKTFRSFVDIGSFTFRF